jgi:hypothetical protein
MALEAVMANIFLLLRIRIRNADPDPWMLIYCRLAKRWVAAQLLSTSVPDTAVEAIMAKIFLSPGALGKFRTSSIGEHAAVQPLTS